MYHPRENRSIELETCIYIYIFESSYLPLLLLLLLVNLSSASIETKRVNSSRWSIWGGVNSLIRPIRGYFNARRHSKGVELPVWPGIHTARSQPRALITGVNREPVTFQSFDRREINFAGATVWQQRSPSRDKRALFPARDRKLAGFAD